MSAATIASPLDCQSVYLSVCLCVCLLAFLSICLSIFLSIFLSVCPSVCLCICVFVCLCICVCVSICPSYGIQHSFCSCRHLHSLFRHLLALSPSSDILYCIVLCCTVLYCVDRRRVDGRYQKSQNRVLCSSICFPSPALTSPYNEPHLL